ncbi:MAG: NapC/NirT family cytochrome c, partial [Rikenellaceae bacterium]
MKKLVLLISIGVIVGVGAMVCFNTVMKKTSTNESCEACHVHPHATDTWKRSVHFNSKSGVMT